MPGSKPISDAPPGLAIICNSVPPYREHFHRRIVNELPQVKLWTVCTHEGDDNRWPHQPPAEINPVSFGREPGVADRHGLNFASFRKGGQIIHWLRENKIRAVLVMGYNDPCRLRVIRWCYKNQVPCFVFGDSNIRGDRATGITATIKAALLRWVTSHVAGVMSCGSLGRDYFLKYGANTSRVYYTPYEPDYDLIANITAGELAEARQRLELLPERRRIVYSGRLVSDKRVDVLIDAFLQIADRRPNWDLVILGDGTLRSTLETSVPDHFRKRVLFLGFMSDQSWVNRVYRLSDVLVLPSDYEPWALVVNEAAAAGMALVCTNVVGAAAELVEDGVNGHLFAPGDTAQLAEALLDVTDSNKTESYRAASKVILQRWRKTGDPIDGLRRALQDAGVITPGRST